jgi:tol-pal system protein YbgF
MVVNMSQFAKAQLSAAAIILGLGIGAAFAADTPSSLAKRLDADQVQIRVLEQKVAAARGVQVAQLFGESDEEKAARQQHEDNQDSQISQLNQRVTDMENSLRQLTGQMEDLGHRMDVVNQNIAKMQKDFDYKICTLAAQQLGASTDAGDPSALPCGGQSTASAQPGTANTVKDANAPIHLTPPSPGGVLGTLPAGNTAPSPAMNGVPPSDTRKKFDAAMNLLARAQYDEAGAAFRSFADTYPQDDLTPQAVYWVGDIAYVQKDYQGAAQAFVEEIKKYPTSPRAPDSMLKLGQSLIAMDQKKEGCSALAALPGKYPSAKTEIDQAKAARKDSCH